MFSLSRPLRPRMAALPLAMLILSLVFLLPACSGVRVHTEVNPDADFSAYETFKFMPKGGATKAAVSRNPKLRLLKDPQFHDYLQDAIGAELSRKGLTRKARRGNAQIRIGYRTIVQTKADHVPPIIGTTRRGQHFVARPGQTRIYREGTLVIDLIDDRTAELIWRGVGIGMMKDMAPGAEMNAAIAKILKDFPPG